MITLGRFLPGRNRHGDIGRSWLLSRFPLAAVMLCAMLASATTSAGVRISSWGRDEGPVLYWDITAAAFTNKAAIQIQPRSFSGSLEQRQRWFEEGTGRVGEFRLKGYFDPGYRHCMSPNGSANGARAVLATCNNSGYWQRWKKEALGQRCDSRRGGCYNLFRLRNIGTGKCLDIKDFALRSGQPVQTWSCNWNWNQLWFYTVY